MDLRDAFPAIPPLSFRFRVCAKLIASIVVGARVRGSERMKPHRQYPGSRGMEMCFGRAGVRREGGKRMQGNETGKGFALPATLLPAGTRE